MFVYSNPPRDQWQDFCRRNIPDDDEIEAAVESIISTVRSKGDAALFEYASRFDHYDGQELRVSEKEIDEAASRVAPEVAEAILKAADNIRPSTRRNCRNPWRWRQCREWYAPKRPWPFAVWVFTSREEGLRYFPPC